MNNVKKSIQKIAYERYQMEWMLTHGITMRDLYSVAEDASDFGYLFEEYLESHGFGCGTLWVCFEEFLQAEYQDIAHMEALLRYSGGSEDLFAEYIEDIGGEVVPWIEARELLSKAVEVEALTQDPDSGNIIVVTLENGEQIRKEQSIESLARDLRFDKEGREIIRAEIQRREAQKKYET